MLDKQMKPVVWVGDSKRRLLEFPREVQRLNWAKELAQKDSENA